MTSEERPLDESSDDISDGVSTIMENTAFLVNRIRASIRENIEIAEELGDLADEFRAISRAQQDMVLRLAEIGTMALKSEFISDEEDEEEEEIDDDTE